jgi:hypothetical protein
MTKRARAPGLYLEVLLAQNLTSKGQVDVILLDFAKAFDKVPHRRLLHKLKFYRVDGSTGIVELRLVPVRPQHSLV